MRLIPAIDIIDGKCVRLQQGDYSRKVIYNENPLEVAKQFNDAGLSYLHVVDLDGAKAGKITNYNVLEKIATKTTLHVDFGGGIRSADDIRIALECGVQQVTVGSAALTQRQEFLQWMNQFGSEKVIFSADVREQNIAIQGWKETTQYNLFETLSDLHEQGLCNVMCTDIFKDGMMQGPAVELYQSILGYSEELASLNLIASGGVRSESDIMALAELELHGVIIGRALYDGSLSVSSLATLQQSLLE
jgi:phosphoribosylformimino-5-aminoimidazole carboxamide ribotide isomerase